MEKDALRVDENVSVHRQKVPLGTRFEVKNIGSILEYIMKLNLKLVGELLSFIMNIK